MNSDVEIEIEMDEIKDRERLEEDYKMINKDYDIYLQKEVKMKEEKNIFREMITSFKVALYPFKGILFFIEHYKMMTKILMKPLIISFVLAMMFYFFYYYILYYPMYQFIGTILNTRHENIEYSTIYILYIMSQLTFLVISSVVLDFSRRSIYDIIFSINNKNVHSLHKMERKERLINMFFQITSKIFIIILTAPFTIIPVIGTITFIVCNSLIYGWKSHTLYLIHVGLTLRVQFKWVIYKNFLSYTYFGITALILDLTPVLSIFFIFTTCIGSALWALELEKENTFKNSYSSKTKKISFKQNSSNKYHILLLLIILSFMFYYYYNYFLYLFGN
eukprot:TRINITY_DN4460_c0_g1_i2.p1 TRINITY_DN4460_c0_g1~~TRINITY_DN4460_c0_g1_i2.p1  ORF type:complete len:334 (+),score=2.48 TRINITY_DN4460_c0_g1_i2:143-1144(+)